MRDYHINIFYSEEDQGYIADIPDLVACSAFGKSPDKALAALLESTASLDSGGEGRGRLYSAAKLCRWASSPRGRGS